MQANILEIRPLAENDHAAFRRLRLEATADSPTAIAPTYQEEAGRTDEENRARIRRTDTQAVFGAFIDGQLAGIAGLRREPLEQLRHKATLWGVFIRPERRHEGLARALLSHVLSYAREEGVLQVQLCVNAENARARSLYHSLGFATYGLEPRAMRVGDRYFAEEHMVVLLDD
jgi:ribosomal protein S18 acetylase RimI-like enzyme